MCYVIFLFFYFLFFFVCFFFFSSRRRHTRWTGDWSSDVCSSDLSTLAMVIPAEGPSLGTPPAGTWMWISRSAKKVVLSPSDSAWARAKESAAWADRSEERRVGKECRCRWAAEPGKKKEWRRESGQ